MEGPKNLGLHIAHLLDKLVANPSDLAADLGDLTADLSDLAAISVIWPPICSRNSLISCLVAGRESSGIWLFSGFSRKGGEPRRKCATVHFILSRRTSSNGAFMAVAHGSAGLRDPARASL